jgi:hypothetical protein
MNNLAALATTRTDLVRASHRAAVAALLAMGLTSVTNGTAHADPARAKSDLTAIVGFGVGQVTVSPNKKYDGTFDARVNVNIHDATANTNFAVTRAIDFTVDGNCTNPQFDTVASLTTSAGGAGAVEFERGPSVLPPDAFDLQVRVVGDDGTVLQSACMTVYVK